MDLSLQELKILCVKQTFFLSHKKETVNNPKPRKSETAWKDNRDGYEKYMEKKESRNLDSCHSPIEACD